MTAILIKDGYLLDLSLPFNPIANLRLGDGVAPVPALRGSGVSVALGIDDASNCDSLSMFENMKFAASIHKLYGNQSQWIGAKDALDMCWDGGAKIMRKKIGSLQPGFLADLIILGTERLFLMPKENFINQLIFKESGTSVETVIVNGQIIMRDKVIKNLDETELYAEARESIKKLYQDIPLINARFPQIFQLLDNMNRAVADYKIPVNRLLSRENE